MINLLKFKNLDISSQLKLEKDLLQNSDEPFCIINNGTKKSLVMGILNKENEWIDIKNAQKENIPIIRRFSGGGSVFVDENTIFVTFVFSKKHLNIEIFPEPIMRWAESFYKKVFGIKNLKLIENDFVIDDKKIGGNAKYIKKDRFLLHTSFLWDFEKEKMKNLLLHPQKAPKYRKDRSHNDFLTSLSKSFLSKEFFIKKIVSHLEKKFKLKKLASIDTSDQKIF